MPSVSHVLHIPETAEDIEGLSYMKALAFKEKLCWSCGVTVADATKEHVKTYQTYKRDYPLKLSHSRIIKDENGKVLAAIQLQLKGDVADLEFPSSMRHRLKDGEAYVSAAILLSC
jgi:hypothetical protein